MEVTGLWMKWCGAVRSGFGGLGEEDAGGEAEEGRGGGKVQDVGVRWELIGSKHRVRAGLRGMKGRWREWGVC